MGGILSFHPTLLMSIVKGEKQNGLILSHGQTVQDRNLNPHLLNVPSGFLPQSCLVPSYLSPMCRNSRERTENWVPWWSLRGFLLSGNHSNSYERDHPAHPGSQASLADWHFPPEAIRFGIPSPWLDIALGYPQPSVCRPQQLELSSPD